MNLCTRLLLIGFLLYVGNSRNARAATYYDVVWDGVELGTDDFADAFAPNNYCRSSIEIDDTLNGLPGTATAYYPGTAEVSLHTAMAESDVATWSRDIIHYGQQRGGNCGPFSEAVFDWPISIKVTYWGPPPTVTVNSDSSWSCTYKNRACTSGTPTCTKMMPALSFTMGGCPGYVKAEYVVVNGQCDFAIATDAGNAGGPCS